MTAPHTYTLHYSPSTASLAVHWMLLEIGAPFELVRVDFDAKEQKSAAYLRLNPTGLVPTLIVDGKPFGECAALLMLLAERHPDKSFAPLSGTPERAAYFQWMFYLANTLQPAFRAWFYPDEPAGEARIEEAKAHARAKIEACFDRIDAHLARSPFLAGTSLSGADFLLTMLTRWSRNMPRPATSWPHLAKYVSERRAMPMLREVHRREELTDWING